MEQRPLILISNDDGVTWNGLRALVEVARTMGEVFVAAPLEHQSGMSSAISLWPPLRTRVIEQSPGLTIVGVSGTPADCVKLAVSTLLKGRQPQLVLSGINHGYNVGISTMYSGTLACGFEGLVHGIPAIAFSCGDFSSNAPMECYKHWVREITTRVLQQGLPEGVLLNVNMPNGQETTIKGLKVTRPDSGRWNNEFTEATDPMGEKFYMVGGEFEMADPNDDTTDLYWLNRGYISVTPCHTDQTAYDAVDTVKKLLDCEG